jgi:fatty acid desaturase
MNIQQALTPVELDRIAERSDLHAAWLFVCNYGIIAGIFAVMAVWPNPLTIVLGTLLLGGRQLGLFVLVHECGHGTLFSSKRMNELAGDWLGAAPTFDDMKHYSRGHLQHHRLAGTHEDPDLPNYRDYPISRARLRRKIMRDLTGQTGWKQTKGLFKALMTFNEQPLERRLALARGLLFNALMLGLFVYLGVAWLYLVWWIALLTSYRLASRLRQVAEHGNVPDLYDPDPRLHTRTVAAPWYDRLLFCPLGVSYHVEHHMMASIPLYNLPKLHKVLKDKGHYDDVVFLPNYSNMLRHVTAMPA